MIFDIIKLGTGLIDKLIPDKEKQAEAKLALLKMEQDGELKTLEVQMSAILAEANSKDPWTSRARPSFLYVIYVMLLMAIPFSLISAFNAEIGRRIAEGFGLWLAAIPEPLYTLFGIGYIGYAGARTWDKHVEAKKNGK